MRSPAEFLRTMERALNHYLRLDPAAMHHMAQLEGRCVGVELLGIGLRFYIQPGEHGVSITEQAEQVDTMLHGTPLAMARLGLGTNTGKTLFSGDVTITGDVETGQAFKAVLDDMDIDWEGQLSHLTGDILAHQVGTALRQFRKMVRAGSATVQQDLAEYLKEELRVVPSRIEIENLAADINRARADTDRLEARIRRLRSALGH